VKHFLRQSLLAGLLFLVWFAPLHSAVGDSVDSKLDEVKVSILPFLYYAPFHVAQKEGFFKEQNLRVEFVKLGRSQRMIAVAQGQIDVSGTLIRASTLNIMQGDSEVRIVADKGFLSTKGCVESALMINQKVYESGRLDSPDGLKGLRISFEPMTMEGYYMEKFLHSKGLVLSDVKSLILPTPASEFEALGKGAVDMVSYSEPWITRTMKLKMGRVYLPVKEIIPGAQYAVVLYGPNLRVQRPDVGKRFMVAYLKGVRQYNQGKTDRNLEIIAEVTRLDPALLKEMCWPAFADDGRIKLQSVLDFQVWALKKGFLRASLPPNRIWDNRFVEYANQHLHTP
jgi:NitT/TauT family transport system substrate-binding protein